MLNKGVEMWSKVDERFQTYLEGQKHRWRKYIWGHKK